MAAGEQGYWIWYPGDWEVWLHERLSAKRKTRGAIYPPFWRLDRHYSSVLYRYSYESEREEEIRITADGEFAAFLDGKDNERTNASCLVLPAGKHELRIAVWNDAAVPALYVVGETVSTSSSWMVSCYDHRWVPAGSWEARLNRMEEPPSRYRLETVPQLPLSVENRADGWFVDFGRETFGYLQFEGIRGQGGLSIYYGESREEAEDRECCVLTDQAVLDGASGGAVTLPESRAFRYVQIVKGEGAGDLELGTIRMLYEYLPVDDRSRFESSNPRLNEIWNTSLYTFHLNTREFFLDGIKRDRWVWSGDAYQSALMNYYSFFDREVVKRTFRALRGKDPVAMHLNTILDYSLYWFVGIYDYYLYTGDLAFVRSQYGSMVSLMDFCLGRRNAGGMMEGMDGDWVFVDWAEMEKQGELSVIQLLLCRSLETMALVSGLVGEEERSERYRDDALVLKKAILEVFWDPGQGGLVHNRVNGVVNPQITKHANMLALLFGYLSAEQADVVKRQVLLNPAVPAITTPYMRFYELAAMCEVGEHGFVLDQVLVYWGGMLDLGATSFWEEYDPKMEGRQHLEMYGMPYGKSLCHAWGASPIYLLGKYYLGVRPLSPGYETFLVEPALGGLDWIKGTVPIGPGEVEVEMDAATIRVRATHGSGILRYQDGHGSWTDIPLPRDGSRLEVRRKTD